jgi:hypothetical protein
MIEALEQIRRMRGGAQSHLMRCSDGNYYVVKFQNNPQHRRIPVNELLGTRLASRLGLPARLWERLQKSLPAAEFTFRATRCASITGTGGMAPGDSCRR